MGPLFLTGPPAVAALSVEVAFAVVGDWLGWRRRWLGLLVCA